MELGLRGETALVVGGTRGLGLACARALAAEGASVIVIGRDVSQGVQVAHALGGARFVAGDIGDPIQRAELIQRVLQSGPPSILVTNAGGPPPGRFEEISAEAWRAAFETNMFAARDLLRAFLPAMRQRGFGRVLNVTSFVVKELYPNMSLSNGLRVGLAGAKGSIAREVAVDGVTVNGPLPGLMDTGALERVIRDRMRRDGLDEASVRRQMAQGIPMGRALAPRRISARCARFWRRAANKTREWLDVQRVDMITDLTHSAAALAALEITRQKNRIAIVNGAGTVRVTNDACTPNSVHDAWDTHAMANSTARTIVKDGGTSWYFLTADYAFGQQIEKDVSEGVGAQGGTVVGASRHLFNASDFSSFVLSAQNSKARIIGLANGGSDTINAIKAARGFRARLRSSRCRARPARWSAREAEAPPPV